MTSSTRVRLGCLLSLGTAGLLICGGTVSSARAADVPSEAEATLAVVTEQFPGLLNASEAETMDVGDEGIIVGEDGGTSRIEIPTDAAAPVTMDGAEVSVAVTDESTPSGSEGDVVQGLVVHPDSFESTDTIVRPVSDSSFEVYYLLADSDAPESFVSSIDLPEGATLTQTGDTSAVALGADGEELLTIEAPWAKDAAGKAVPLRLSVEGSSVTLHVAHNENSDVTYPVLVDPLFYTDGDHVHISSTAPPTASAHGWWVALDSSYKTKTATVTVKIQFKYSDGWRTVETKQGDVAPGGGRGKRVTAREQCSSTASYGTWRSSIDTDINWVVDSPEVAYTDEVRLKCRP